MLAKRDAPAGMSEAITQGALLDGRVRYHQFAAGYRTGIEPVLLAAAVPARAGERVLEAGCGAGAGLLCLAARVPGVAGVGVERDPALAALAAANIRSNGWEGRLRIEAADIAVWADATRFEHAMANPPWHDPAGTASPDPGRRAAKIAGPGVLGIWVAALVARLRPRGTVSFILPASEMDLAATTLRHAGCGSITLIPLWPRAGRPARLVIVQALRGGRGATTLAAGLCLHDGRGYSALTEDILRRGQALDMAAVSALRR